MQWAKEHGFGLDEVAQSQIERYSGLLEDMLAEGQEEAGKLNECHNELIDKAMQALKDLRDFEINELGMKEENAIVGDPNEHRDSAEEETQE